VGWRMWSAEGHLTPERRREKRDDAGERGGAA